MEIKAKVLLRVSVLAIKTPLKGVITFMIDRHTIKRGILWLSGYQVPLGVIIHVHAFRT